jgi:Holliday junction resolvasome RuvABC endonuclease subunit
MTLLALDLAASYGWCAVDDNGAYIASGHRTLRASASRGEKAHQLAMSIADLIDEYGPDWVVIEKPHSPHYGAARNLFLFAGIAEMVAHIHERGYFELARSECYARVVGKGNAKKVSGIEFARRFKPLCNSDDESDAILVAFAAHQVRMESKEAA